MPLKDTLHFDTEPLYLIDGSSFLYRGFYAFRDMSRSDGLPTNTLFYNLRVLLRLLREEKPKYVGYVLDGKGKTFRHDMYEEYKANRASMPEPLQQQVAPLKEAVELLGLNLTVSDGVEADDCIASLAADHKKDRPVVILGSDKDLKQCLDKNVYLWNPLGKQEKLLTLEEFQEESGLTPAQWPDFQAVIGDSSDNIPGIPGVGPKTAEKMFAEYPTLEALKEGYKNLKPKLAAKVEEHLDNVFLFRELTRMKIDCCRDMGIEEFAIKQPGQPMVDFLKTYELRTLSREFAAQYPELDGGTSGKAPAHRDAPVQKKPETAQLSLFGNAAPAPAAEKAEPMDVTVVTKAIELPSPVMEDMALVLFEDTVFIGLGDKEYRYDGPVADLLPKLNEAASIVTPDVHELYRADEIWREVPLGKWFDLALAAYLLNPEERGYGWERLRQTVTNPAPDAPDADDIQPVLPSAQGIAALAYAKLLRPKITAAGLTDLMADLETPLVPVLDTMERNGVALDLKAFDGFLDEVGQGIERLTGSIHEQAGEDFNIRSSQQLGKILFERLELKPGGKTSGGQLSTAVSVLEKIRSQHPIIDDILEFRKLEKLRSTYLEPLPKLADESGRIHTNFNRLATATGRLSSSGPNLQNIPIRGPQGKRMRACFTAAEGMAFAAADYSQVELRVLAHCSQDPALVSAFMDDEDIHSRTAALIFDKDSSEAVTPDERSNAKTINFGLIYGMGPQRLSRELGVTMTVAKEFIERYFKRLGTLKAYYDNLVAEATASGYVTTLAGRRRLLPELHSRNQQLVSQAKRQAVNTVIQGSAADVIKLAMLAVHGDDELANLDAKLLLQVHDELLLETPQGKEAAAASRLKAIMQGVTELAVPLKVDAGTGKTWAEAH